MAYINLNSHNLSITTIPPIGNVNSLILGYANHSTISLEPLAPTNVKVHMRKRQLFMTSLLAYNSFFGSLDTMPKS